MQSTGFAYNERGWLKSSTSNEFSMQLNYQDGTIPQWNGNIANQYWGTGNSFPNVYTYDYDKLNRLKSGVSSGISMSENITYDEMGNIKTLARDGSNANFYHYNGNQLWYAEYVTNGYAYDANGNATTDGRNGMTLTYNYLNLPATANKSGTSLAYTYNAAGQKLAKNYNGSIRNYINGIEYKPDGTIDVIHTEEGLAQNNSGTYTYKYNLSDHLGNVRYTFDIYNGAVRRLQSDDYYAFGKRKSVSPVSTDNKYLYNGKEVQDELGEQYDYGARFYDPVIGRWNVIDRLSEYHFNTNPYHYVLNNPMKYIDPFGLDTVKPNQIVPPTPGVRPFNPDVDVISLEATVKGNSNSKTGFIITLIGATSAGAEKMMHNKETWYSLRQMTNYSQKYFGNQYQSAQMVSKAKGLSKSVGKGFKWLGRGIGAYNFYNINADYFSGKEQYNGRRMSDEMFVMEQASNTFSTFGGTAGAGWGIGWEIGREIASDPGYRKNVRPVLQDLLGVERDEYPRYNEKLQELINNIKPE